MTKLIDPRQPRFDEAKRRYALELERAALLKECREIARRYSITSVNIPEKGSIGALRGARDILHTMSLLVDRRQRAA